MITIDWSIGFPMIGFYRLSTPGLYHLCGSLVWNTSIRTICQSRLIRWLVWVIWRNCWRGIWVYFGTWSRKNICCFLARNNMASEHSFSTAINLLRQAREVLRVFGIRKDKTWYVRASDIGYHSSQPWHNRKCSL